MLRGPTIETREFGSVELNKNKCTRPPTFDYVVVGAGPSAMGFLMGLLEQDLHRTMKGERRRQSWTVAIVERGSSESPDPSTRHLNQWYKAANARRGSARQFSSEITGRALSVPVGQGLGGTSNINAGLVTEPLVEDFDLWPEPWKTSLIDSIGHIQQRLHANKALRYRQPVHDFKENVSQPAAERSAKGLLWRSNVPTLEAYEENEVSGPGTGNGEWIRRTYFNALIEPLLKEYPHLTKNLQWFLDTEVQRLLIREEKPISESETESRNWIVSKPRVYGVECRSMVAKAKSRRTFHSEEGPSSFFEIHAAHAVIMCTGAIESPALLLASGIGPEQHQHLQGVGRHLKDQVLVPRSYLVLPKWPWSWSWCSFSSQRKSSSDNTNGQKAKNNLFSTGNGIAALGHIYLPTGRGHQEIFQVAIVDAASQDCIVPSTVALAFRRRVRSRLMQVMVECLFEGIRVAIIFLLRWTPIGYVLRHFSVTLLIFLMHPKSEGCVTIQSLKPSNQFSPVNTDVGEEQVQQAGRIQQRQKWQRRTDLMVQVDVGYLRDRKDMKSLHLAWNSVEIGSNSMATKSSIGQRNTIVEIFPKWLFPPAIFQLFSLDWFSIYCKYFAQPYYHFSGSCAMQHNPQRLDWVVDAELRLREHEGIFICDASVFPSMISSPPALTCCAMGFLFGGRLLSSDKQNHGTAINYYRD